MIARLLHSALVIVLVTIASPSVAAERVPDGRAQITVNVDGTALEVFTYRPAAYRDGPLLVTFHGVKRDADTYRNSAVPLADRFGMLVIAPHFDEKRFPTKEYQ